MMNPMQQPWKRWQQSRREKLAACHLQKHCTVLKEGLCLYADVLDCSPTPITGAQMALLRLRLSIPLKNRKASEVLSSTFTSLSPQTIKGKRLRIRLRPGDLSHVAIVL